MNEDEPFLKRWSRRKVEAKDGGKPDSGVPAAKGDARPAASPGDAQPDRKGAAPPQDNRELTEADFADVDFEALDMKSDYRRFLAPGVPDSIKHKALRKLWSSDAVFTTPDPFQDYLHDYTDAAVAVPPGTLKTAYRVGKGFLSDEEAAEWEKLGKPVEAEAAAASAAGQGEPVSVAPETADQPEVHALLRQSDAYHAALYPAESNHLVDVGLLAAPNVRFLVARCAGTAIGCGALVIGKDGEA